MPGVLVNIPQSLTYCWHSTRFLFSAKRKPVEPERNAERCGGRHRFFRNRAQSARFRGLTFLRSDAPVRAAQVRRRTAGCGIRGLVGILVRSKGCGIFPGPFYNELQSLSWCRIHPISFRHAGKKRGGAAKKGALGQGANRPLTTPVGAAFGKGRFCGRKRTGWVPENRCDVRYNASD